MGETVPIWPRQALVCMVPGCRYLSALTGTVGTAICPAHGTVLALQLVMLWQPEKGERDGE